MVVINVRKGKKSSALNLDVKRTKYHVEDEFDDLSELLACYFRW